MENKLLLKVNLNHFYTASDSLSINIYTYSIGYDWLTWLKTNIIKQ